MTTWSQRMKQFVPRHPPCSRMCRDLQVQLFAPSSVQVADVTGWVRWAELSPPEYYTAVEVISVRCLNVHHATGRSTWFFPSKVPHIPVNQAVKAQTRSVAAQPYSVQLAQSDSRATSIRAGSTHCASYRDLHLWDDWSYKKCWQFSANLHTLLLLLLI